jgi:Ca2+-binding EF-hand superfamily protein
MASELPSGGAQVAEDNHDDQSSANPSEQLQIEEDRHSAHSHGHHHHHHHHAIVPPRGVDYATDTRRQLKDLFSIYDRDGNGTLGLVEVRELLTLLEGTPPTDMELKMLVAKVMAMGEGEGGEELESLDLDGFVRFMEIVTADDNRPVTARQIFRAFDIDGNGKLTAQELHEYAMSVGMDMSRSEADAMVQRAGKKGHVTFEQFETGVFTLKSKLGKQDAGESRLTN